MTKRKLLNRVNKPLLKVNKSIITKWNKNKILFNNSLSNNNQHAEKISHNMRLEEEYLKREQEMNDVEK